jgi:hypothetical protein
MHSIIGLSFLLQRCPLFDFEPRAVNEERFMAASKSVICTNPVRKILASN